MGAPLEAMFRFSLLLAIAPLVAGCPSGDGNRGGGPAPTVATPNAPAALGIAQLEIRVETATASAEKSPSREKPETASAPSEKKSRPADKLVFVEESDPTCSVQYFDVTKQQTVKLFTPTSCTTRIAVLDDRSSVILITDQALQEIAVAGNAVVKPSISLPAPTVTNEWSPAKPIGAGYLDEGLLYVVFDSVAPWDDSELYQYVHQEGKWVLREKKLCQRLAERCEFKSKPSRPAKASFWGDERSIWHDKQMQNPYVARRTSRTEKSKDGDTITTWDLSLKFGERESLLRYLTEEGPDSGATLTMGVQLSVQGQERQVLANQQCSAWLMGKYLLLRRYWGEGAELIDLEAGRSVRQRLKIAEWMY